MATFTGQTGVLSVAGSNLAEVTSFTIDHTVNTIESTAMGDQYRSYKVGMNEWSGSADIIYDDTVYDNLAAILVGDGAGQNSGSDVAVVAYPGGNASGSPKLSGNVLVTGFSVSSEMEGMVTATISFQGTGALTYAEEA